MIGFVVQVLFLINEASGTEKFWDEMDTRARMASHSKSGSVRQSFTATKSQREAFDDKESIWSTILPQFRNAKKELRRQTLIFKALREEFILERSLDPSFEPTPLPQRVEEDFNFGRYLSLSQALVLSHIVEVEERTWFLFALGTCAFFGICELAGRDIEVCVMCDEMNSAYVAACNAFVLTFFRYRYTLKDHFIHLGGDWMGCLVQ